jgi:hypothetical protein
MGANPYIPDVYKKDAKRLFGETGGNTGNLAFQYAVASHLSGNVAMLPWETPAAEVRAAGDVIVLPLANQLGRHTDLGFNAGRLEEFALPVIGVGLGAQADAQSNTIELSAGTLAWLKTTARLSPGPSPNIGVRGAYTRAQIEHFGVADSAVITGCPSNFLNHSDVATRIQEGFTRRPRHIAVMAGIPFIPKLATIERSLADIVTVTGSSYIVQHGLEMLRLARGEFDLMQPAEFEICRGYIAPQLQPDEFRTWCRRHAIAFYDARTWMDYLRRFDFVVGTRFHGAMLAMQAGVPAGCITHDSRTQEMCETMGIPHCHYAAMNGALTQHTIMDYFSFDAELYRETRRELLQRYLGLFRSADVAVSRSLDALCANAS